MEQPENNNVIGISTSCNKIKENDFIVTSGYSHCCQDVMNKLILENEELRIEIRKRITAVTSYCLTEISETEESVGQLFNILNEKEHVMDEDYEFEINHLEPIRTAIQSITDLIKNLNKKMFYLQEKNEFFSNIISHHEDEYVVNKIMEIRNKFNSLSPNLEILLLKLQLLRDRLEEVLTSNSAKAA